MAFWQWCVAFTCLCLAVIESAPVQEDVDAVLENSIDQVDPVQIAKMVAAEEKVAANDEVAKSEQDGMKGKSINFLQAAAHTEFDPSKFLGTWYHIYRLKWSHHLYKSEVNSIELMDDGTIQAKSVYYDGEKCSEVETSIYTQSKNHTAMWNFGTYGGVSVLFTDYAHALLLICDEVQRDGTCEASKLEVEVLARSIDEVSEEVKSKSIAVVKELGLSRDDFELIPNQDIEQCKLEVEEKSCNISNYKVMQDFDHDMFSGEWHEVERTRASKYDTWQSGLLYFSMDDSYNFIQYTGVKDGKCMGPFKAYGPIVNTGNSAADMYMLIGSPEEHMFNPWSMHYHYKVLYTDGEVALTYSCISEKDDGSCKDWAKQVSILSREHEIDDVTRSKLYGMIQERLCVDPSELQKVLIQEEHCELEVESSGETLELMNSWESGEGVSDESGEGSGQTELVVMEDVDPGFELGVLPGIELEVEPEVEPEMETEVEVQTEAENEVELQDMSN